MKTLDVQSLIENYSDGENAKGILESFALEMLDDAPIVIKMSATDYLRLNPRPPLNENI